MNLLQIGVVATGLLSWVLAPRVSAEGLQVGLARIEITPEQPVTLSGYSSRTNLSQGVHDPLAARVVAFEQDGQRLLLMSLDLIGFYGGVAEPIRQAILDACHLRPSELFLCAIHTHSAPTLSLDPAKAHAHNVEYTRALTGKLVEVARQAMGQLGPAWMGFGSGSSPVGANRRETVRDSAGNTKVVLGRNPYGFTDREVQVLKLTRRDRDELIGALFAYATHSTAMGPRNYRISGDVHGLAAQFLERQLGATVVTPVFAGASGNIDPWFRVLPEFNTTNGWIPEPVLLGTLLGEEVAHVLKTVQKPAPGGPMKSAIRTVQLPGKVRGDGTAGAVSLTAPFVITAGCIGEIAFVGLGGEVFTEIGQAIKKSSPFPHTLVFTHCNDAAGYVPTRASYPEGGYEVQSSPFGPGADERLAEEVKRMLTELR